MRNSKTTQPTSTVRGESQRASMTHAKLEDTTTHTGFAKRRGLKQAAASVRSGGGLAKVEDLVPIQLRDAIHHDLFDFALALLYQSIE